MNPFYSLGLYIKKSYKSMDEKDIAFFPFLANWNTCLLVKTGEVSLPTDNMFQKCTAAHTPLACISQAVHRTTTIIECDIPPHYWRTTNSNLTSRKKGCRQYCHSLNRYNHDRQTPRNCMCMFCTKASEETWIKRTCKLS